MKFYDKTACSERWVQIFMMGLSIKTESAHADLYINTWRHRHSLLSSFYTQRVELLRAFFSDNCLFGQRETNGAGIFSERV